ncbi:peptide/nickel transport system substrate-binding protein [Bradyrhizobium sp. NFR13]|uniref:ABC transporter substrate-binding protein n=1 Tax=Bradyrhizobium sp. NFR13 TaxID=1566285 RepID=UPI0008E7FF06|nr:ABC transporter substrate-binding protein [Bradyrhizobium sp. NFR13]SFM05297.1 peptide/nickel transport system substrate-binding protein [Bradyrhizobium sp. NFR13]
MRMRSAFVALVAAFAFAGPVAAEEPIRGGTMRIVMTADIRTLDASRSDNLTDHVLNHIYEQLVAHRNDMTIGPAAAESWTVSPDGKTYSFKLRDGMTYHNGDRVKAADVKWLWDRRMAAPKSGAPWVCAASFDGSRGMKVESVEAPDDGTVVFTLDKPNTLFLIRLADIVCNFWIASPKNVDADGNWIAGSAIGSGSFKLKEWRKEQYVSLERFADYVPSKQKRDGFGGDRTSYFDEVRFVVIPDKTAAETALLAGQVDIVTYLQVSRIEEMKKRGAIVKTAPGLSLSAVLIQTSDPLMSNVKIRRALAHAIDFKEMAETKLLGLTEFNPSGVAESSAYFDKSFQAWPKYDPEAAKKLLKEAGYKGEPIKMQTNKRYIGMYENAVVVQAMLNAAGFNVQLDVIDWAAQLENWMSGKFQLQSFGYSSRADPMLMYGTIIGNKVKAPTSQWDDAEAQALYLKALTTTSFDERKALLKQLHAKMAEEVPILGLYYYPVIEAVSPKLVNYESWPLEKPRAWGVWKKP